MYLRDDDPYVEEHAMIIKEILKQRMTGIKNKSGVYITPTFPKLIYVLGENNITEDSKYYEITRLAAECTAKRMYPDYISEKVMKENYDGSVFGCMGCLAGNEIITYKLDEQLYVEAFEDVWDRLKITNTVKIQPAGGENLYIEPKNMKVWDNVKHDFVKVLRFNRNEKSDMVRIALDNSKNNSRIITCTKDHIFTTVEGINKRADELDTDTLGDEILISNYQYSKESINYPNTWEIGFTVRSIFNPHLRKISSIMFNWDEKSKLDWLAGYIESYFDKTVLLTGETETNKDNLTSTFVLPCLINNDDKGKVFALKLSALFRSVNVQASIFYSVKEDMYCVRIWFTSKLIDHIRTLEIRNNIIPSDLVQFTDENEVGKVVGCEKLDRKEYSYDLTTKSDHFEVSGVYSHNCRSFLSIYVDPETGERKWEGRLTTSKVKPTLNDVNA